MKKKYVVCNVGCDDETYAIVSLTEEEYLFLNKTFKYISKHSNCSCQPKIFINPIDSIGEDRCQHSKRKRCNRLCCCEDEIRETIKERKIEKIRKGKGK